MPHKSCCSSKRMQKTGREKTAKSHKSFPTSVCACAIQADTECRGVVFLALSSCPTFENCYFLGGKGKKKSLQQKALSVFCYHAFWVQVAPQLGVPVSTASSITRTSCAVSGWACRPCPASSCWSSWLEEIWNPSWGRHGPDRWGKSKLYFI